MNRKTRHFLITGLLNLILFPTSLLGQQTYSKEINDRMLSVENSLSGAIVIEGDQGANIQQKMDAYLIPAVSIAVIKDYKIDWVKAYGIADLAEKRPASTTTPFQAASISKSLNAVNMLRLAQENRVNLHEDINNYLNSWKFPYDSISKNKKISIANLLSHTAGLSVHGFAGYKPGNEIPTTIEILNGTPPANSVAVRSNNEPGTKSVYSGGGTTISQLITSDISKKNYNEHLLETVLKPMGMMHSFYYQHPTLGHAKNLATAYQTNGQEIAGKHHIYPEMAAAALWTTPGDLANFIIETQLSLQGKSNKVLSKEMTQLMLTPYLDRASGLGVFIEKRGGKSYFGHGGANAGFRSQYYGSLDGGNGVVVMVNSDNGSIIPEIINSVAKVYNWEGFYQPVVKKIATVPTEISQTYVGRYQISPQIIVNVINENGQLKVSAPGIGTHEIYPEAENKYFLKSENSQLEFLKNESGVVDQVLIHRGGGNMMAKKL